MVLLVLVMVRTSLMFHNHSHSHACLPIGNKEWLWIITPLVAIAMFGFFCSGGLLGLGESRELENYLC